MSPTSRWRRPAVLAGSLALAVAATLSGCAGFLSPMLPPINGEIPTYVCKDEIGPEIGLNSESGASVTIKFKRECEWKYMPANTAPSNIGGAQRHDLGGWSLYSRIAPFSSGGFTCLFDVSCYAPMSMHKPGQGNGFYVKLSSTTLALPKRDGQAIVRLKQDGVLSGERSVAYHLQDNELWLDDATGAATWAAGLIRQHKLLDVEVVVPDLPAEVATADNVVALTSSLMQESGAVATASASRILDWRICQGWNGRGCLEP